MTLDSSFLSSSSTAYPTRATMSYTLYSQYIDDTDVSQANPGNNYATSSTLWVGRYNGYKYRSYFHLCFPASLRVNPNAVTTAYMNIYERSGNVSQFKLQSKIPNNTWSYTSLTWNSSVNDSSTMHSVYSGISAPALVTLSSNTNQYIPVNMTEFVQRVLRNYIDTSLPGTVHEQRGFEFNLQTENDAAPSTHLRIFNSTNHSENKPYITVNYNNNFGAANIFRNASAGYINCWAYALEYANNLNPCIETENGQRVDIDTAAQLILDYMISHSTILSARRIYSYSDSITNQEYRIACRVDLVPTLDAPTSTGFGLEGYHFVVQINTGEWAHKRGLSYIATELGYISPSVYGDYWQDISDSASERTIYYAVRPYRCS